MIGVFSLLLATLGADSFDPGLIQLDSQNSVSETLDRLEAQIKKLNEGKGIPIRVMARVKHQENAKSVNMELQEIELLIFGNPALGTQLMQAEATAGIDLPMKALAWKNTEGKVLLAYNDPQFLAARHGIDKELPVLAQMSKALSGLMNHASSKD